MKIFINRFILIRNFALFLLLLTFASCDPAQTLLISNETDADATVIVVFNKGAHYYKFVEPSASDTLVINLEPQGQNSQKVFQFGIGTWNIQSSIDSLIAAVDLIEIKTSKSKEIFQGEKQIRAFIEERVSGRQKELIEIKVN
ncbi:MAG: hypothetical protein ACI8RP_002016 [Urechidicola sp.]|jgi:hypothetical protein